MSTELRGQWAIILGASSGFGAAAARELASRGVHVAGVHLDRRSTMPAVEQLIADIEGHGVQAHFFNINAADHTKRAETVAAMRERIGEQPIRLLMHSIAFGTLKPLVGDDAKGSMTASQVEMTLNVMASSLVYWAQDLAFAGLLGDGTRVVAMTSAGSTRCWPSYGAVSAAKAALEAYVRQLALELAPRGVSVNAIRAGVTDTPALRKIPGHEEMLDEMRRRNPFSRLTTPEDVAGAIATLCDRSCDWISGNVIGVDGAEDAVA